MALLVAHVAEALGASICGQSVSGAVTGVADLAEATEQQLSFYTSARYRQALRQTRAKIILVDRRNWPALQQSLGEDEQARTYLLCDDAYLALAHLAQRFDKERQAQTDTRHIDKGAHIDPSAQIGLGCRIEAGAVVAADAVLEPHCILMANSVVGAKSHLGTGCYLAPGAKVLWGCRLGARVVLQAGAIVGSDGFGFALDKATGRRHKIPQLGGVTIGDDVDIGANTTIDRATFGQTVIGDGCKIDNLVQIAHNVTLGADCVIVSQSGIAGSTHIGARVVIGAQGGVAGHVRVADDTILAARAGVANNIETAGVFAGTPLLPLTQWRKAMVSLQHLPRMRQRLRALERLLAPSEDQVSP